MIGYLLLLISVFLYYTRKYRYLSIFFFIGLISGFDGGYGILTENIIGVNTGKLAFIYLIIISISFPKIYKNIIVPQKIKRSVIVFLAFTIMSFVYSFFRYGVAFTEILAVGYSMFLILAIFLFTSLSIPDIEKIISLIIYITFVASILYIVQVITGIKLMPYKLTPVPYWNGLFRFYNSPPFLMFCLCYSFILDGNDKSIINIKLQRLIYVLAAICTLGRTYIFSVLLLILLSVMLGKYKFRLKKLILFIIIGSFVLLPLGKSIMDKKSYADISYIINGTFSDNYGSDATMSYRIAWIYERLEHMSRNSMDLVFGLGWMEEGGRKCLETYNFRLGLYDEEAGYVSQIGTPDIAYGHLLTRFGLLGGVIFLIIIFQYINLFYKNRCLSKLFLSAFIVLFIQLVDSFSGSTMARTSFIGFYSLLVILAQKYKYGQNINCNSLL